MKWQAGITTVPSRKKDLLPRTIASLKAGGFTNMRLFVDGDNTPHEWEDEYGLPTTCRDPALRTAGNWVMSLYELWVRDTGADLYAIFQDDCVCSLNLKPYLDALAHKRYPGNGLYKEYWNLYTFPQNQNLAPKSAAGGTEYGFFRANQLGKGAVGLVLPTDAVLDLLGDRSFVERHRDPARGHKSIDGGIVTCLKKHGWTELCHHPSLLQHTGEQSSMGNAKHRLAENFKGEDFDLLTLL
jgi:hypothetical protein